MTTGVGRGSQVASGADGSSLVRRLYRRSPLRQFVKVTWAHRDIRPTDVFLASYPRSGSSWLRFLLYEMTAGDASFQRISVEVPYIGFHHEAPALLGSGGRLIKTHEPYLRRYGRAVHLVRDPRDVAISYFRFMQRIEKMVLKPGDDEAASFDHFIDALVAGRVDAHGTWQSHVLSWTDPDAERSSDILHVRYEDLRAGPAGGVQRIAGWLGLGLSAADAARVVERCTIERMREAEADTCANSPSTFIPSARRSGVSLINQGRVAGWREAMTDAQQGKFAVFNEGLQRMGYDPAG